MQSGAAHIPTVVVRLVNLTSCIPSELRSLSEMQSEEARDHCDHNDYADDVKNIHSFLLRLITRERRGEFAHR
jgi:hypothetical protein